MFPTRYSQVFNGSRKAEIFGDHSDFIRRVSGSSVRWIKKLVTKLIHENTDEPQAPDIAERIRGSKYFQKLVSHIVEVQKRKDSNLTIAVHDLHIEGVQGYSDTLARYNNR